MVIGGDGSLSTRPKVTRVVTGADANTYLGALDNRWVTAYFFLAPTVSSDARIKTNVQPISLGLGALMKLQPLTYFKHKSHFENGSVVLEADGMQEAGFLAQDVSGIIPTAVHRPEEDSKALWSMRYEQIIPYTVKAVQELKAENDQLRSELDVLKAEMAEIKALLKK